MTVLSSMTTDAIPISDEASAQAAIEKDGEFTPIKAINLIIRLEEIRTLNLCFGGLIQQALRKPQRNKFLNWKKNLCQGSL